MPGITSVQANKSNPKIGGLTPAQQAAATYDPAAAIAAPAVAAASGVSGFLSGPSQLIATYAVSGAWVVVGVTLLVLGVVIIVSQSRAGKSVIGSAVAGVRSGVKVAAVA